MDNISNQEDTRWVQRFNSYNKAFTRLEILVIKFIEDGYGDIQFDDGEKEEVAEDDPDNIYREALIKRFEYTQELSWRVIKDFYEAQGETGIQGSKDAFQLAFQRGLIVDGKVFMDSIESRNQTSHSYNEETAKEICLDILKEYYPAFKQLKHTLEQEIQKRNLNGNQ